MQIAQATDSTLPFTIAAIALGGNLPAPGGLAPEATLAAALTRLAGGGMTLVAVSRFYRTPAFPPGSGADFVNAAALVRTGLGPAELLDRLHAIEAHFGRTRSARWGARTLDIDLIFADGHVLPDEATAAGWMALAPALQGQRAPDGLILPHPRLQDRAFVLIPLAEIAPGWRHPLTGRSVAEMARALPEAEKAAVRPL